MMFKQSNGLESGENGKQREGEAALSLLEMMISTKVTNK